MATATAEPMSTAKAWLLASRLRTLTAAVAPVAVGAGLALHDGVFSALPVAAALLGALFIQVGTNLANDYYDHQKGADTDRRVGPTRVTQAGLLAPAQVRTAMVLSFAAAIAVGGYLVWVGGWPIVVIGLASVAAGILYTGGPWPFGYHGLGDLFVMVFFGLVAVAGTYYVQALAWSPGALVAGLGVGAMATAVLVVNNLRDLETDRAAGKRTLATRIGARATQFEYILLLLVAMVVPLIGFQFLAWPRTALFGTVAVAAALPSLRVVYRFRDPRELNHALAGTGMAVGVYGLLFAAGLML